MKMKRILTTLALVTSLCTVMAQKPALDAELDNLLKIVLSLRESSAASQRQAYNAALQSLAADTRWTPMNELRDTKGGECKPADKSLKRFRLNSLLSNAERSRQGLSTTAGNMLNGEDENYNFSLYEKSVMAHKAVSYQLKGRSGQQTFIIVPYDKTAASLTAVLKTKAGTVKGKPMSDGTIHLVGKAAKGEVLTLELTNGGSQPVAFIVLNHNTKK